MIPGGLSRRAQSALAYTDRRIESGERRGDGVEVGAVAKALKVDPIELFTRFVLDEMRSAGPHEKEPKKASQYTILDARMMAIGAWMEETAWVWMLK